MKMKASSLTVICLALVLLQLHFSEGRGKGKTSRPSSSGSSSGSKSSSSSGTSSSSGSSSNKANSNKPSQTNHGYGHSQPGGHGNTNPSWNSPNRRGHGTRGGYGGHQGGYGTGHQGGYGTGHGTGYGGYSHGGYQRSDNNRNPANKIASPYYSDGSYGGYNIRGGSPFSQSVQGSGRFPTDESRGFGRKAALAAAGGAAGGMAMGYGLGRMHRPDFHLNSPQEEYYYNHYMYKKHGTKTAKTEGNRANRGSTDSNVNEDHTFSDNEAPLTYNGYMEKCIMGLEHDQVKIKEQSNQPTVAATSAARTSRSLTTPAASDGAGSNKTAVNESRPSLSVASDDPHEEQTVSIVEIGYPALINQHNVKTCLERFFTYSETIGGGAQAMATGSQGLVALATSVMLMLLNSNLLVSLFSC